MNDQEKKSDQEVVGMIFGIWYRCRVVCVDCAGTDRIQAAAETDKIRRKNVLSSYCCDICGKPLVEEER